MQSDDDDLTGWVPQSEAAAIIGVSARTLARWCAHLPKKRFGHGKQCTIFYREADIERIRVMRNGRTAEKEAAVLGAMRDGIPATEIIRRVGITLEEFERIRKAAERINEFERDRKAEAMAAARGGGFHVDEESAMQLAGLLDMDRPNAKLLVQKIATLCEKCERLTFR
jgi:hypothetical protein